MILDSQNTMLSLKVLSKKEAKEQQIKNYSILKWMGSKKSNLDLSDNPTKKALEKNIGSFLSQNYLTVCPTNSPIYLNNLKIIIHKLEEIGLLTLEKGADKKPPIIVGLSQELENCLTNKVLDQIKRSNLKCYIEHNIDLKNMDDFMQQIVSAKTNNQSLDTFVALKMVAKQRSCAIRGIEFDLSFGELKKIFKRKYCYYSGVEMDLWSGKNRVTLDRIDCTKGYVKGNVVACSVFANEFKNKLVEGKDLFRASGLSEENQKKLISNLLKLM